MVRHGDSFPECVKFFPWPLFYAPASRPGLSDCLYGPVPWRWLHSVPGRSCVKGVNGMVATALKLALAFLPAPIVALILGALAVLLVILVFKIAAMVLDAIPFL